MVISGIWIYDKEDNSCRIFGYDKHDSLDLWEEGIHYHNLHNGDGGGFIDKEGFGYRIMTKQELEKIDKRLHDKGIAIDDGMYDSFSYDIVVGIDNLGTDKESYHYLKDLEKIRLEEKEAMERANERLRELFAEQNGRRLTIEELKYIDNLLQKRLEELENKPNYNGVSVARQCKTKIEKQIEIREKDAKESK